MLVDFWQENFKVQVEARTGAIHIHIRGIEHHFDVILISCGHPDDQPRKRRKVKSTGQVDGMGSFHEQAIFNYDNMEVDQVFDFGGNVNDHSWRGSN